MEEKKQFLVVAESFYSIQGEGQTMGVPAVFLRLAGCNLLCKGSGWVCDTIEVWQKGRAVPFKDVLSVAHVQQLRQGAHLVITGGEPLVHQKVIVKFLQWFEFTYFFLPTIEIETNGTIIPNDDIFLFINYWNCSPKLSGSGESYARRVNNVAIEKIQKHGTSVIFKFVISQPDEILEIFEDYPMVDTKKIVLMPAGATQEELNNIRPHVVDLAKFYGFRYCDRLHVVIWNKKTGV